MRDFIKNDCKKILRQNADIEKVLDYLRRNNYSKTQSMILLTEIMDVNLGKAKEIVHFSQAWQEEREAHEQFHELIEKFLEQDKF